MTEGVKVPEQDWWLYHYGVNNFAEAAKKFKVADDKADHEIRLTWGKVSPGSAESIRISCTCGEWSFTMDPGGEKKTGAALEVWKEQHAALL